MTWTEGHLFYFSNRVMPSVYSKLLALILIYSSQGLSVIRIRIGYWKRNISRFTEILNCLMRQVILTNLESTSQKLQNSDFAHKLMCHIGRAALGSGQLDMVVKFEYRILESYR